MSRKIAGNSKRLSLVVPEKTYQVISAVAQIHCLSMNDVVNNVLELFVEKNLSAISAVEEIKKSAQEKYPIQGQTSLFEDVPADEEAG